MSAVDIDAYLGRIGYSGSREPTLATLAALQRAHRLAVPFESIDIHIGRPLSIDEDRLFDKIVRQRRGGWCHELNGLWARALRQLGFHVDVIGAQVVSLTSSPNQPFGHCTTLVHLEGEEWWSDVGFGVRLQQPARLREAGPQFFGDWEVEFSNGGAEWEMRSVIPNQPGLGLRFPLTPRDFEEFRATAEWQQTSPESLFTQRPVCAMFTEDGRIALVGDTVTIERGAERQQHTAANEGELDGLLREHFGLELGEHAWRGFPWRPS